MGDASRYYGYSWQPSSVRIAEHAHEIGLLDRSDVEAVRAASVR